MTCCTLKAVRYLQVATLELICAGGGWLQWHCICVWADLQWQDSYHAGYHLRARDHSLGGGRHLPPDKQHAGPGVPPASLLHGGKQFLHTLPYPFPTAVMQMICSGKGPNTIRSYLHYQSKRYDRELYVGGSIRTITVNQPTFQPSEAVPSGVSRIAN